MNGKNTWFFADGYLPEKVSNGPMEAHEALMLFNAWEFTTLKSTCISATANL